MAKQEIRILRRLIRLGNSFAVTIPPALAPKSEFIWIEKTPEGLRIKEAKIE